MNSWAELVKMTSKLILFISATLQRDFCGRKRDYNELMGRISANPLQSHSAYLLCVSERFPGNYQSLDEDLMGRIVPKDAQTE